MPLRLVTKFLNHCVLIAIRYESEIQTAATLLERKLASAEGGKEGLMQGIILIYWKTKPLIRKQTNVEDILNNMKRRKNSRQVTYSRDGAAQEKGN